MNASPRITTAPYTRWWWFSGKLSSEEICSQLDWVKANGFGGVEIAWVYPLEDSEIGPAFLSSEWSSLVAAAKSHADAIGIGCDFTFGTLWPFGGSFVSKKDACRSFHGLSDKRLRRSWEEPHSPPGFIINHLDKMALHRYSKKMGAALSQSLKGKPSFLFCDSWEVPVDLLWTDGFDRTFIDLFGYDINPYMDSLDSYPDIRYDYRKAIADYVLNQFYKPFTKICHELKACSRVQCHGAPVDLIAAYSMADIPETEAILFDPPFARFASSAAALTGRTYVSSETFTCLYGWVPHPNRPPHLKQEKIGDMKLLADSLFANGVNFIVWHGMPFQSKTKSNEFYATVHVGPDSGFISQLPPFNDYLARISQRMREGSPYHDIAVYLPLEDNQMKNRLPHGLKRPSAEYYWELHYQRAPEELTGFQPLWITDHFFENARVENRRLIVGCCEFGLLYIDCAYLEERSLENIIKFASAGLPVCIKRKPKQPGHLISVDYSKSLEKLLRFDNVRSELHDFSSIAPLISGDDLPEFWSRRIENGYRFFFAHPNSKDLHYPLRYEQYKEAKNESRPIRIHLPKRSILYSLEFAPNASVMFDISDHGDLEPVSPGNSTFD